MRRGQYADSGVSSMMAAQMQHVSAQRMQQSPMSHYSGRMDSMRADEEQHYMSSKAEAQWQRERDGAKGSDLMPSHMYKEGQGADASHSVFRGQRSDSKSSLENQGSRELRDQGRQDEMRVGYEDNTFPQTFEGLEQKFLQDILNITKELNDAEDMENARHRERLIEINTHYQEKALAARASQVTHREEFLRKESQVRYEQYQQANINSYQNAGSSDAHGYGPAASAIEDAHRAYATVHHDSYGEEPEYSRDPRGRGFEPRSQYPGGRAYNSGGRYY